jgi:hypothetical protein
MQEQLDVNRMLQGAHQTPRDQVERGERRARERDALAGQRGVESRARSGRAPVAIDYPGRPLVDPPRSHPIAEKTTAGGRSPRRAVSGGPRPSHWTDTGLLIAPGR